MRQTELCTGDYILEYMLTQVQESSMLFVDNPVGAGFSYVDTEDAYTTDVEQVASDLLTLLAQFLEVNPEFKVTLGHYSHPRTRRTPHEFTSHRTQQK